MFGTLFGVVIVAIITQALVIFRIDPFFVQVVLGLLILWAVGVNRLREVRFQTRRRRGRGHDAHLASRRAAFTRRFPGVLALQDVAIDDARAARSTRCSARTARANRR